MKARNVIFAALICLMLCGPAALYLSERAGIAVPQWLTTEDANYLSGSEGSANVRETATLEGFRTKAFQNAVETEVSAHVPAKAHALMATAAWQRDAIRASNALFGWECYPTFYSSEIVDIPSEKRLAEIAKKADEEITACAQRVAGALDALGLEFPNVRFFVYLGPDTLNVSGAPTEDLVSNLLTYEGVQALFEEQGGAFQMIDGDMGYTDFKKQWFSTDHHWNNAGAYDAYGRIATALGFGDELLQIEDEHVFEEPVFYGALARRGLITDYSDCIADYAFKNFPNLTVRINGSEAEMEDLLHSEIYAEEAWDANRYANRYAEYYHGDKGLIEFSNPEVGSSEELLIVTDSYSNSMERLLAAHYRTTYALDPRHASTTVAQFLEEHEGVSDVVIIMREANLLYETTEKALAL